MKLILFGASNPEPIRLIRSIERCVANVRVIGFLDNDKAKHNTEFYGYPILGGGECVSRLAEDTSVRFVNLITRTMRIRFEISKEMADHGAIFGSLIHPSVDMTMVSIGAGAYIQEAVILQAAVSVGHNTSIHIGTLVGHETKIGNTVFVAHGVSISGCCSIGDGTFIGTNATIMPRLSIGKWCIIGAGAVVTKNVPDYAVVAGNPARILRNNDVPYPDGNVPNFRGDE